MAFFRIMGRDSIEYHRRTVLGRDDDHAGAALAYYGTRGETPLVWGGKVAERLGLSGGVTDETYDAIFGRGGAIDPVLGERLVRTKRPGVELVVAAHKSVAVLGVIGFVDDMHAILDAESDATLQYLETWFERQGGRRTRAQHRVPTGGLVWARTRHATSRAGDPAPHDHVLIANLTEMLDAGGGWKALDTAALRDVNHAATMAGRMAAAEVAVRLGYAIERDDGPSGRLGHWRLAGIPDEACEVLSKRSEEIDLHMESVGFQGDIDEAIDWYLANERVVIAPDRGQALDGIVDGWLTDERDGTSTLLLAWRRVDVAALNARARDAWASEGRLSGPEYAAPGGRAYAVGDRVVALAPLADGALVTSERAVVTSVFEAGLTVTKPDGRIVRLANEDTDARHLDHAYAVTVHRAQGATVDRAHLFADGGGRELAYVAMSRARESTHVHVVADDVDQAVDDLRREWSIERRDRWVLDVDSPAAEGDRRRPDLAARARDGLRSARLRVERAAVLATVPPDRSRALFDAHREIHRIETSIGDLQTGRGEFDGTPVGQAALRLSEAKRDVRTADGVLRGGGLGWRLRRQWTSDREAAERAVERWQETYDRLAAPIHTQLEDQLSISRTRLTSLDRDQTERQTRARSVDVSARLRTIERELGHEPAPEVESFGMEL